MPTRRWKRRYWDRRYRHYRGLVTGIFCQQLQCVLQGSNACSHPSADLYRAAGDGHPPRRMLASRGLAVQVENGPGRSMLAGRISAVHAGA